MKKELKDYLHLYLGCECETKDGIMELSSIELNDRFPVWFRRKWDNKSLSYKPHRNAQILTKDNHVGRGFRYSQVKPILRPLSDMTDEEKEVIWWRLDDHMLFSPRDFQYLLSHRFDLFGLIESGLSIDKTTLK